MKFLRRSSYSVIADTGNILPFGSRVSPTFDAILLLISAVPTRIVPSIFSPIGVFARHFRSNLASDINIRHHRRLHHDGSSIFLQMQICVTVNLAAARWIPLSSFPWSDLLAIHHARRTSVFSRFSQHTWAYPIALSGHRRNLFICVASAHLMVA